MAWRHEILCGSYLNLEGAEATFFFIVSQLSYNQKIMIQSHSHDTSTAPVIIVTLTATMIITNTINISITTTLMITPVSILASAYQSFLPAVVWYQLAPPTGIQPHTTRRWNLMGIGSQRRRFLLLGPRWTPRSMSSRGIWRAPTPTSWQLSTPQGQLVVGWLARRVPPPPV